MEPAQDRSRSITRMVTTAVTALAAGGLLLAACGSDDGTSEADREVIDALVDEGATEEEATCFVDALGADTVEKFIHADEDSVSADDQEAALAALDDCGVELGG